MGILIAGSRKGHREGYGEGYKWVRKTHRSGKKGLQIGHISGKPWDSEKPIGRAKKMSKRKANERTRTRGLLGGPARRQRHGASETEYLESIEIRLWVTVLYGSIRHPNCIRFFKYFP